MPSMRKLRRQLRRWGQYATRYGYPSPEALLSLHVEPLKVLPLGGHCRAWDAVEIERERREARYWPADDPRCCLVGNLGHDGPCVVRCDGCNGDSRCPECGGVDDLGCWHCDGTGGCPHGCDDGEIVLEEWTPARIPDVVTIVPAGGVL